MAWRRGRPLLRGNKMISPVTVFSEGKVFLSGHCQVTGEPWSLCVDQKAYQEWQDGMLIQNAFPDMPYTDRELLISGTSAEGWKLLFGDDDE